MTIDVLREPANDTNGYVKKISEAHMVVEFGQVEFRFTSNPKGRNDSLFHVYVSPDDFRNLAQAMMRANSIEAIKAFGAALEAGIPEPREIWFPGIDKGN